MLFTLKKVITSWKRSNVTLEHYVPYTVTLPKVSVNQWHTADYLQTSVTFLKVIAEIIELFFVILYRNSVNFAFLANVNSRSPFTFAICCRPSVCRLSVVCNVRAPYSCGSNFRQYFYLGHPLTSTENFMEIVRGEPLRRGS